MIISELRAQKSGVNKLAQPSIAVCVLLPAIITAKVGYFFSSAKFLSKKVFVGRIWLFGVDQLIS